LANDLWNRNLVIGADRGKIITSDNKIIADNLTTVSLVIVPNQVKDKDKVVHDIANILNVDEEVIRKHVYKKSSVEIVHPEGRQLSYEENFSGEPIIVGHINESTGTITLYESFALNVGSSTKYYISIWLDGNIADSQYVNQSFSGYIKASAIQQDQ
jgi:cell division protein FtsI/penicillin-binding protein 2